MVICELKLGHRPDLCARACSGRLRLRCVVPAEIAHSKRVPRKTVEQVRVACQCAENSRTQFWLLIYGGRNLPQQDSHPAGRPPPERPPGVKERQSHMTKANFRLANAVGVSVICQREVGRSSHLGGCAEASGRARKPGDRRRRPCACLGVGVALCAQPKSVLPSRHAHRHESCV